jgi:hypothetical protein
MAMNTSTFAKTVALTWYDKPFKIAADESVWDWKKLFSVSKMEFGQWQTYQYTGFGSANQLGELRPVVFENAYELAATTISAVKYAKGFILSEELQDDNRQIKGLLQSWAKSLGRSHSYAREVAVASVFNNAFDSSYTGFDSVELCGSHTTNSGTAIDNDLGPSSISYSTIWDMVKYFNYQIYDEAGLPVSDVPIYIQTNPANQDVLDEILKTRGPNRSKPDSADNNANVLPDRLTPVYNRLLTSTTAYFMHGKKMKDHLIFKQRKPMSVKWKDAFENFGRKCRTGQRFGYGFTDYRFLVGNPGA